MLTDQAWDSDAEDEDEYMFQRKHQVPWPRVLHRLTPTAVRSACPSVGRCPVLVTHTARRKDI